MPRAGERRAGDARTPPPVARASGGVHSQPEQRLAGVRAHNVAAAVIEEKHAEHAAMLVRLDAIGAVIVGTTSSTMFECWSRSPGDR